MSPDSPRWLGANNRGLVADSGAGPFEATITGVDADGTLVLVVHAFVPAHA
jgi:hypothetical protein